MCPFYRVQGAGVWRAAGGIQPGAPPHPAHGKGTVWFRSIGLYAVWTGVSNPVAINITIGILQLPNLTPKLDNTWQ